MIEQVFILRTADRHYICEAKGDDIEKGHQYVIHTDGTDTRIICIADAMVGLAKTAVDYPNWVEVRVDDL